MSEKLKNLFGTTRMMLFEHRDELVERSKNKQCKHHRPELDEQQWMEINDRLMYSYQEQASIDVVLYDPHGNEVVSGVVTALDAQRKRIRLGERWIAADDLLDVV